ncbi:MAG: transcriptional regulator, partial [Gracilibacteraceae bacterium]|nr:transcriptional regulator [Gracilibacteraceae bacterium]
MKIDIQQVFLRNFDADDIVKAARARIEAGQTLSDEETMKLIIAPLAKSTLSKQSLLEKCIDLAKNIDDDWQQSFLIAGMLVAADKFINRDYSHMLRRWLNMTKIGQL